MTRSKNKKLNKRRQQKFVSRLRNEPEVVSYKEIISNVAAMFCYHRKDVAELLEYYSNDNVERIAKQFVDINENRAFVFRKGRIRLTVDVDADIIKPVKILVTLKMNDIQSGKMMRAMINELFKYNKKGKYGI